MSRLLLVLTIIMAALPCDAWRNAERVTLEKAIESFRSSKDLVMATQHDGQGIYQYHFKYTCKGGEITDPSFRPAVLTSLEQAFAYNTTTALSYYTHRANAGRSPLKSISFWWPNTYHGGVSFGYDLNDDTDYRFVSYGAPDTVRVCYALVWNEVRFTDHAGAPYRSFDGYIITLTGNHWDYYVYNNQYVYEQEESAARKRNKEQEEAPEQLAFAMLSAKMDELDKLFAGADKANDVQRINAVSYAAEKLLDDYKKKLAPQMSVQIAAIMDKWKNAMEKAHMAARYKRMTRTLSDKTVAPSTADKKYNTVSPMPNFSNMNLRKHDDVRMFCRQYNYNEADFIADAPWELTGTVPKDCRYVSVRTFPQDGVKHVRTVKDGAFSFKKWLSRGQFVGVSDDSGENCWWVISDSLPVNINLEDGTIEGSDLNKRFISYQKRIRNLARDVRKYASCVCGHFTIIDTAGYYSLVDSVRAVQYEAMTDNPDNIIPAFYLSELCTEMPPSLLDSVMKRGLAYSDHVTMQPVWNFYEGQKRRLPGQLYHDVKLVDTSGNSHALSEYVGKGNYVLLHFWSTWTLNTRNELKFIKEIVRDYADKPLTVIGISLNADGDDWRKYVKVRNLRWTHLSNIKSWDSPVAKEYGVLSLPMTVLIAPDGTIVMQGVQRRELKERIRELVR